MVKKNLTNNLSGGAHSVNRIPSVLFGAFRWSPWVKKRKKDFPKFSQGGPHG